MYKDVKKPTGKEHSTINPIEDPKEAIDFYMPLPDEVYRKWRKK